MRLTLRIGTAVFQQEWERSYLRILNNGLKYEELPSLLQLASGIFKQDI